MIPDMDRRHQNLRLLRHHLRAHRLPQVRGSKRVSSASAPFSGRKITRHLTWICVTITVVGRRRLIVLFPQFKFLAPLFQRYLSRTHRRRKHQNRKPFSRLIDRPRECVSCLDDYESGDMIKLTCHSYCKECFQRLIRLISLPPLTLNIC